jgi:hypothetical protein
MKNEQLRELEFVPFSRRPASEAFCRFCERSILPEVKIDGYKLDEKRDLLMQQVLALVRTDFAGKVVADGRSTSDARNRVRSKLWDSLAEAGFCLACFGSEKSGKVTRYRAGERLMDLREVWEQRLLRSQTPRPGTGTVHRSRDLQKERG